MSKLKRIIKSIRETVVVLKWSTLGRPTELPVTVTPPVGPCKRFILRFMRLNGEVNAQEIYWKSGMPDFQMYKALSQLVREGKIAGPDPKGSKPLPKCHTEWHYKLAE